MDNSESELQELLNKISEDDKLNSQIYNASGIYFIITNGRIKEISDDASCSPKGGWFPKIFSGLNHKQHNAFEILMKEYTFEDDFFDNMKSECWDINDMGDNEIEKFFKENEDENSLNTIIIIRKKIENGDIPFSSLSDFAVLLKRFSLSEERLYYMWEGEAIDFYDNISDVGEEPGYYDSLSDEEWVEILENINDYVVTADK